MNATPTKRSRHTDLIGKRFDRLVVVSRAANTAGGRARWFCACDCGGSKVTEASELKRGSVRSCGCLAKEQRTINGEKTRLAAADHPYSKQALPGLKKTWENMLARCYNPSHKSFKDYGVRGIHVCERWRESFQSFADDMGPRPGSDYSIDRFNANGDYSPENCCWATRKAQANNRRNNRLLTHDGQTLTLMQWSERVGIPYPRLYARVRRGWGAHDALHK